MIPPAADAEFAAHLENVLEIYAQPDDPRHPVVCLDEQPVPWIGETRVAIPATKTHAKRVDDESERPGTASIFRLAEPLSALRQATARPQRTKSDWAVEGAHRLDTRYAKCELVTLVSDHLNTHTSGACEEAFPPEQARADVNRLDLVHPPKHGSWLNIAEGGRSCRTSQCLAARRIGDLDLLQSEIAAWSEKTNTKQRGVDGHFQLEDARIKLKKLYPKIKT